MKKALFLALLFPVLLYGQLKQDFVFSTQEQIDQFPAQYPGLTVLDGDVTIGGDIITNLDSLSQVQEILGELRISGCGSLTNISGLSNIQNIGGINFYYNNRLKVVDCFSQITTIPGSLILFSNDSLQDLSSFQNLTEVGQQFRVTGTKILEDLSAFSNLKKIGQSFNFSNNDLIEEVNGFEETDSLFYMYIGSNPSLKHFNALQNLEDMGQQAHFLGNDSLEELNFPALKKGEYILVERNDRLSSINFQNLEIVETLNIKENENLQIIEDFIRLDSALYIAIENNKRLKSLRMISSINHLAGLKIHKNDSIEEITGFSNLEKIGSLELNLNKYLKKIDAFHQLDSVTGDLIIYKHNYITDLNAFEQLRYIGGGLDLSFSIRLPVCPTFISLNYIGGDFTLLRFDSIPDLSGFSSLKRIEGETLIKSNFSLESFNGLNQLESFGSHVYLENNRGLLSFDGLNNLKKIEGNVNIEDNYSLENLKALSSLTNITGTLRIVDQPALETLSGLDHLQTIGSFFFLWYLDGLKDLSGLQSLRSVGKRFSVGKNSQLFAMDGLHSLERVNELYIEENPSLKILGYWPAFHNVGNLSVNGNLKLESIYAMENANISGWLYIYDNPQLSVCDVESVCKKIVASSNNTTIQNNAEGCNSPAEILENCENQGVVEETAFPIKAHFPQWNVMEVDTATLPHQVWTNQIQYQQDFIIDGEQYSGIILKDNYPMIYILSEEQKAWYRKSAAENDQKFLLYDFSLSLGDTVYLGLENLTKEKVASDSMTYVIVNVETINLNGEPQKSMTLQAVENNTHFAQLHWIEGMGCLEHPFYPFAQYNEILEGKDRLLCYYEDGLQFYQNPNYQTCDTNYTAINELTLYDWKIAPNPFQNNLRISNEEVKILDIHMFTITGQEIPLHWTRNTQTTQIQILEEGSHGVCLLQIITAQGSQIIKLLRLGDFTD